VPAAGFKPNKTVVLVAAACAAGLVSLVPAYGARNNTSTQASAARCATSGLVVWLNTNGDGAAGSTYFKLEFTNLSGHTCTLAGYPGVSAIDLAGHQIGAAASRSPSAAHVVTLASAATATATLRIVQAGNFPPSACGQKTAAGLRVFPPNQTASKLIPFPFPTCARTGSRILNVGAVA
jgi:Protein of unknown function (DUF4232)